VLTAGSPDFFRRAADDRLVARDQDRAFDQARVLDHGVDQFCFAEFRIGQVEAFVLFFACTQQLPGGEPQLVQQSTELGCGGGRFQVAHDFGRQTAGFKQLQGAARFGAARVVIQREFGHLWLRLAG